MLKRPQCMEVALRLQQGGIPKIRRRHAYPFGKSGGEGSQTLLSDLQYNIANAQIRAQQQLFCLLQPEG